MWGLLIVGVEEMKKEIMRHALLIALVASFIAGCATGTGGLNSAAKTNQLRPGMTTQEVTALLGQPASSQYMDGYMIWKYSLQRPWVGWIPYYLAFDGSAMRLAGWQENMQEYYASQSLWLQALPKQHNVHMNGTINQNVNVQGTIRHDVNVR
jgi:hypothetical protein